MKFLLAPAALLVIGLSVACGSNDSDDSGDTTSVPTTAATAQNDGPVSSSTATGSTAPTATTAAGSSAAVQEITVTAAENGQQYAFQVSSTNLKPGKVKVTFTNNGPDRPHSFVVSNPAGQQIIEITQTQPGQTKTAEFEVPVAGSYKFICELPGHADRGQNGTFTVS